MKLVGLIGGTSWESTRLYYDMMNRQVRERMGGLSSANMLVRSLDFRYPAQLVNTGGWDELGALLGEEAARLEAAGAQCVALATNTMHKCADAITARISVPFLHVVDAAADGLKADGRKRPLLLGTRPAMEDGFIQERLAQSGLDAVTPDKPARDRMHEIIFSELVMGVVHDGSRKEVEAMIDVAAEAGCDSVILGCTEIVMLIDPKTSRLPGYDTTALHAAALVEFSCGQD